MPLVNALPKSSKAPPVNAASPASFKGCAFFFSPGLAAVGTARGFVTARRSRRRGWHLLFSRERLNLGQEYMYLFKFLGGLIESSLDSALWSLPRSVPAAGGTDPAPAAGPFLQSPLPRNPPELGAPAARTGRWVRGRDLPARSLPGSSPHRAGSAPAPRAGFGPWEGSGEPCSCASEPGLLRSRVSAAFLSPPPACIWRLGTGTQIASS